MSGDRNSTEGAGDLPVEVDGKLNKTLKRKYDDADLGSGAASSGTLVVQEQASQVVGGWAKKAFEGPQQKKARLDLGGGELNGMGFQQPELPAVDNPFGGGGQVHLFKDHGTSEGEAGATNYMTTYLAQTYPHFAEAWGNAERMHFALPVGLPVYHDRTFRSEQSTSSNFRSFSREGFLSLPLLSIIIKKLTLGGAASEGVFPKINNPWKAAEDLFTGDIFRYCGFTQAIEEMGTDGGKQEFGLQTAYGGKIDDIVDIFSRVGRPIKPGCGLGIIWWDATEGFEAEEEKRRMAGEPSWLSQDSYIKLYDVDQKTQSVRLKEKRYFRPQPIVLAPGERCPRRLYNAPGRRPGHFQYLVTATKSSMMTHPENYLSVQESLSCRCENTPTKRDLAKKAMGETFDGRVPGLPKLEGVVAPPHA